MKDRKNQLRERLGTGLRSILTPIGKGVSKIFAFLYKYPLLMNIVLSFILAVVLEVLGRQTFPLGTFGFMTEKTTIFLYSMFIIFFSYSIVFVVRHRIYVYAIITLLWGMVGFVNFMMLSSRNTPFTYVDITLMKAVLPVITNYYSITEIIMMAVGILVALLFIVCGYMYLPTEEKFIKSRWMKNVGLFAFIAVAFAGTTVYGLKNDMITTEIHNIRLAYSDYGTPYCFSVTALKTGISTPSNYSEKHIKDIIKKSDQGIKKLKKKTNTKKQTPNIIFVQLESHFDITQVKNVKFNKDPLEHFHKYMRNYSSGHTMMPSYGAGTANTEFEIMTQMNLDVFGAAEYPYKTVLQENTCESFLTDLKEEGYATHAIHNNSAAFYDRDLVFANIGYDSFQTKETMDIKEWTENGWAKDKVLTKQIINCLDSTEEQDAIYTISVQGHGDYPTDEIVENPVIFVEDGIEEGSDLYRKYTYYANQVDQMDDFVEDLVQALDKRGEPTILVMYGDHLPSLDIEDEDLTYGEKYWTSYFVWDNIGLPKKDGNIEAYQLASEIMNRVGIHTGIFTRFHQTQKKSKSYIKDLTNLQYDTFYGKNYLWDQNNPYEATDITFGVKDLKVSKIYESEDSVFITGKNFTSYAKVLVEGNKVSTTFHNDHMIEISKEDIRDGDTFEVDIISKAPRTLRRSPEYVFKLNSEK